MSLIKRADSDESEKVVDLEGNNSNNETSYQEPKKSLFDKLKTIVIALVVIGALAFGGYMFYTNGKTILVDNPTDKEITVKFNSDGKEIKIPAKTGVKMDFKKGENEVFLEGKSVGKFEKDFMDFSVFLNPTKSIYISEYWLYSDRDGYDRYLPNNKIEAYGNKTEGPFKKYEGLYIKGTWDYYLNQDFPESVSLGKRKHYKIKEKLFRYDDFVEMYNKDYAQQ